MYVCARAYFLPLQSVKRKDWNLAQTQKCVGFYAGFVAWQVSALRK